VVQNDELPNKTLCTVCTEQLEKCKENIKMKLLNNNKCKKLQQLEVNKLNVLSKRYNSFLKITLITILVLFNVFFFVEKNYLLINYGNYIILVSLLVYVILYFKQKTHKTQE